MYGLPSDFDGNFIVGRVVEMVCFAQHQVYVHLSERLTITIEGMFSYGGGPPSMPQSRDAALVGSVGFSVLSASGTSDGTLQLEFSNGNALRLFDSGAQYESYSIVLPGREIIV